LQYIFDWFLDLHGSRIYTNIANRLSYQEIDAFEHGNVLQMSIWERHLIRRLDNAAVEALNSRIDKPKSANAIPVTQQNRLIDSIRSRIAAQKKQNK
jgi:hypothetical protein